jgi:DNA polymerase-3 subunit beta
MTTVQVSALRSELEWASRFVEKKATIPVLTAVLLRQQDNRLFLTATDLEIGGLTSLPASGDDFAYAIPPRDLLAYLKRVEEPEVILEPVIQPGQPLVGPHVEGCDGVSGTPGCCEPVTDLTLSLTIRHGDNSVDINGYESTQFPQLPAAPTDMISLSGLEKAVPAALISISKEVSRFTLNGALLYIDKTQTSLISTDGHRLSLVDIHSDARPSKPLTALIRARGLSEAERLGDSVSFGADADHVYFVQGTRTVVSRKLTGNFPDWQRVIPKDYPYTVGVQVEALKKAADRLKLFADDRSHAIAFSVGDKMELRAEDTGRGKAAAAIPIIAPGAFAYPFGSGLNASYLLDFLRQSGADYVSLAFRKPSEAFCLDAPGWKYVLMPMRGCDPQAAVLTGEYSPLASWKTDTGETPIPEPMPRFEYPALRLPAPALKPVAAPKPPKVSAPKPTPAPVAIPTEGVGQRITELEGLLATLRQERAARLDFTEQEGTITERWDRINALDRAEGDLVAEYARITGRNYATLMSRARNSDEGRQIHREHELLLNSLDRSIGIAPICGPSGSGYSYRGFSTVSPKERRQWVKAAKAINPSIAAEIAAYIQQGADMDASWQSLLAAERGGVKTPKAKAAPAPTMPVTGDKPADWATWTPGRKAAWTRKNRAAA